MQVNLLGYEHNPEIMLLAARALTFLADVYPPACSAIIRHGAVPAFCARWVGHVTGPPSSGPLGRCQLGAQSWGAEAGTVSVEFSVDS